MSAEAFFNYTRIFHQIRHSGFASFSNLALRGTVTLHYITLQKIQVETVVTLHTL